MGPVEPRGGGFNEGPVYPESYRALEETGMVIKRRVLQPEGSLVLREYAESGVIY